MRARTARTGALFALLGAAFGLISAVTPDAAVRDEDLLVIASVLSVALALALFSTGDRLPVAGFHVVALLGIALASTAIYAWGTASAFPPLPYLLVVLFAFYFFRLRAALAHMTLVGIAYAVVLALEDTGRTQVDGWIATIGTLLLAGLVIAVLRDRLVGTSERLAQLATRDPLTELPNRRGFEDAFDLELERARRSGVPLSLIVLDVDGLARVNETHGHAAGDDALRMVAGALRQVKRTFDTAARVGGEEFALLAPDCDEHGAYMLAERARVDVAAASVAAGQNLTLSLGIATFPAHGSSPEGLLRAADHALRAAKVSGRDRTVISSAEVAGAAGPAPRGGSEPRVGLAALLRIAEALDLRDTGSTSHSQRVGRFAELTARELGLAPDTVERVRLAGILHDLGRVGIPDTLARKRGPLSDREWSWVQAHPEVGARMVGTTEFDDIRSWILLHHERPDGRGYPSGASDVPLEASILAVADAYEAMTRERPHRGARSQEEAADELRRWSGRQFDPDVVEALLRVV
ncbi:MAG: diguanylate cyclase [Thermoleophilaceae bacterium]|nr:diguanylate cyclase [Thermoleophilaceae bacterium]